MIRVSPTESHDFVTGAGEGMCFFVPLKRIVITWTWLVDRVYPVAMLRLFGSLVSMAI